MMTPNRFALQPRLGALYAAQLRLPGRSDGIPTPALHPPSAPRCDAADTPWAALHRRAEAS